MATATVEPEVNNEVSEIDVKAEMMLAQCKSVLTITTPEQDLMACEYAKGLTELEQLIGKEHDENIQNAHNLHKSLIAKRDRWLKPVTEMKKALVAAVSNFRREAERQRLLEEERQREIARKEAEDLAAKQAQDAQIAAAVQAENEGDKALAEEIMQAPTVVAPVYVPPVVVPSVVHKTVGVSKPVENWKARVTNESLVPREFLMVDEQKLNQYARAMKKQANVAGVEFYDAGTVRIKL